LKKYALTKKPQQPDKKQPKRQQTQTGSLFTAKPETILPIKKFPAITGKL
jgi:hypothetical protein